MCECYGYMGWVLDRCDGKYGTPEATAAIGSIATAMHIDIPDGILCPPQFSNALLALFFKDIFTYPPASYSDGLAALDGDLDLSNFDPPEGNGGGAKVYRLREGIERFLVTDINNPGASAQAQSTITIMFDTVASNGVNFNHIPGGSNVLYMDGHVEFQRYEQNGDFPCNGTVALLVGLVAENS